MAAKWTYRGNKVDSELLMYHPQQTEGDTRYYSKQIHQIQIQANSAEPDSNIPDSAAGRHEHTLTGEATVPPGEVVSNSIDAASGLNSWMEYFYISISCVPPATVVSLPRLSVIATTVYI